MVKRNTEKKLNRVNHQDNSRLKWTEDGSDGVWDITVNRSTT